MINYKFLLCFQKVAHYFQSGEEQVYEVYLPEDNGGRFDILYYIHSIPTFLFQDNFLSISHIHTH